MLKALKAISIYIRFDNNNTYELEHKGPLLYRDPYIGPYNKYRYYNIAKKLIERQIIVPIIKEE